MAKQLNIFIENKPGRLKSITDILLNSNINILAFTLQDRKDFGLVKLLVNKPEQAYLALADKGYACALKDILAVSIKDKPGNLHKLTTILFDNNINVIDAHGFVIQPNKQGICCIEVENAAKIKELVEKEGFTVLEESQLYEL